MKLEFILEKVDKVTPQGKKIKILAVTKNRTPSEIKPLFAQGIEMIGENRVQEAQQKFPELFDSAFSVERHLIGSLQSNKENKALELFDVIQSIESLPQLTSVIKKIKEKNKHTNLFLQYNTSLEESKHGICSEKELYTMIELLLENPDIIFRGLMTIGALSEEERVVRKSFEKLTCIKHDIIVKYPQLPHLELSMGMSNDFEWAIQEGADIIRLGQILFN